MLHTEKQLVLEIAEAIRAECIKAALKGYDNAATSGLCEEGAREAAISAIQMLDMADILELFDVKSD